MEVEEFSKTLQELVNKKLEWFNSSCLENMLEQYRLVHTCVKNLYDILVRRSVIVDDPYRLDKRIHDIVLPDSEPFTESELPTIFGARLSDYETMLDFICTYFRFSVENMNLNNIKKLVSFNNFFEWAKLSSNSTKVNTRALAISLNNVKSAGDAVANSTVTDSITKCGQTTELINKELAELASFERELYKCELRNDLFDHPDFRKDRAFQSEEQEMQEIRRLYPKVMGKKPFYSDLIGEIIKEDQGPDKEKRQQAVIKKLQLKNGAGSDVDKKKKKKAQPDSRTLLLAAVSSLGIIGPLVGQLRIKLSENFDLLFSKKKSFFNKLAEAIKKVFGIEDKKRVVFLPVKDTSTGSEKVQKVEVAEFIHELMKKEHIYSGIGTKGPEYQRIEASSDEATLNFLNNQISEMQGTYNMIRSLDSYFKSEVDILLRPRIKGVQMELSTLRTAIINVNKKRGEYVSFVEEAEQMKRLGIVDEE